MRIINKKYLLIILLVGVIITGVIVAKPKEEVKLDNVILKQDLNNKTFAMYKEDDDNNYVKVEDNKFPDMYVLNLTESKCIDNNGNELNEVLSYENDKVTITSGNTTYCYLYFDKSLGLEIKEKNPSGLKAEKVRGAMYRFQGQQSEGINNYICFGTSDQNACKGDTDKYMYRIIGIEASTGRVKVIKKEALNKTINWYDNYDEDIEFPKSNIYNAINGTNFLQNEDYIPSNWKEKISDNTWTYGDMLSNDTMGAKQIGEELYKVETGQKGTIWDEKAKEDDPGATSAVVENDESSHNGETVYYIPHNDEKWTKIFEGKVSLMYLHDYHYSVSDDANCQYDQNNYGVCRTGWMHLSQNDKEAPSSHEWTMSRFGWWHRDGFFIGHAIDTSGNSGYARLTRGYVVRPVFFIKASEKLLNKEATGTITDPFIIAN